MKLYCNGGGFVVAAAAATGGTNARVLRCDDPGRVSIALFLRFVRLIMFVYAFSQ